MGMNFSDGSCPLEMSRGSCPVGMNLLDGSCSAEISRKSASCLIGDEPPEGQLSNQG